MSIKPYMVNVFRFGKWEQVSTDQLLPCDLLSLVRCKDDVPVPADVLILDGSCIANEAMLSGESTPQLKESIDIRESDEIFNIDADKGHVVFGGTKVLQVTMGSGEIKTPDGGALTMVLRTGFSTEQGKLVRTIIYSTERVTANNMEALLFILFLLVFAMIASWYVWTEGSKDDERSQSKLLLHCILIITSVVPPELPMELSLAVNNSLVALSKMYIFCTEPFRIPFAGRVDVACFDKTGTLTAENLIVEGVAGLNGIHPSDNLNDKNSIPVDTCRVLAAAHALALLDDGIIGDPMEKNTLEWINWNLSSSNLVTAKTKGTSDKLKIIRRFQFSSQLKRMSTVSTIPDTNKIFVAVKGAPETIQGMLSKVPDGYEEDYKNWSRKGKRVLALAFKYLNIPSAKVRYLVYLIFFRLKTCIEVRWSRDYSLLGFWSFSVL